MSENRNLTGKQLRFRRKRRRRRIFFGLEILLLLVLVGVLFVFAKLGKMNFRELDRDGIIVNPEISERDDLSGYTTIGLVGLDNRREENLSLTQGRSDTMIIASINHDTKKIKLVSVYRDAYLRVGEDEMKNGVYRKANEAYERGGPEQFLSMLNTNMDLNVTEYVSVDFNAVAKVAELLGGIDVDLREEEIVHLNNYCVSTSEETGMSYTPLKQEAGVHHLNGVQTVAYARIRKTIGADFRRAARQRDVIYKLADKAKSASLSTLNKIVDEVFPMVSTSLSKVDVISLGMNLLSYEIEGQAGFPHDHLWGKNVEIRMDGYDCVVPVTLESNAVWLHEFLYPEQRYEPSAAVKKYSEWIKNKSGYTEENRLDYSEDGALDNYRALDK